MNRAVLKALAALRGAGPVTKKVSNASRDFGKAAQSALLDAGMAPQYGPLSATDSLSALQQVKRFAASPEAAGLLSTVPGLAALYGTTAVADVIGQGYDTLSGVEADQDRSWANTGMDLLGMGAGLAGAHYGVNRGLKRVGGTTSPLSAILLASGAGVGKMGTDAVQAVLGM